MTLLVALTRANVISCVPPPIRGASVNEFEPSLARIVFATPFKVTPVRVRVPAVPELSPTEIDLFVVERYSIAPRINDPLAPVLLLTPLLELGEKLMPTMVAAKAMLLKAATSLLAPSAIDLLFASTPG